MEPCLFRHGKVPGILAIRPMNTLLQWSHVFSDMVSPLENWFCRLMVRLQWSHVFSDMVSTFREVMPGRLVEASMEPCLFRHGKREIAMVKEILEGGFNGAMSFQTW